MKRESHKKDRSKVFSDASFSSSLSKETFVRLYNRVAAEGAIVIFEC